jgi:uncharacterized LabA/DUF88 family protein
VVVVDRLPVCLNAQHVDEGEKRIALLIDADNAPASKIDVILAEVARHGAANVRRAYGNWKSPHLKQWEGVLHSYAIRPIQQFAYSSGKNASADGLKVYGFGQKKTPEPFVNACSKFTYVERLGQPTSKPDEPALKSTDSQKLRGDTRLMQMLRTAVDSASGDDGWAHLGEVGNQIGNQASFDPRNYGYRKLSDLVEATGLFEIKRQNLMVMVRDNRKT